MAGRSGQSLPQEWNLNPDAYPPDGTRFQVSEQGGLEPIWLNESELAYRDGHTWYRVVVEGQEDRPIGEPHVWFSDPRFADTGGRSHLLSPG